MTEPAASDNNTPAPSIAERAIPVDRAGSNPFDSSAPRNPIDPGVNPRSRGHNGWGDNWPNKQAATSAREQRPGEPTPARPAADGSPKSIKVGDLEVSETELGDFIAERAARESGKLSAPQSPDGYEAALPSDFVAPEGLGPITFDESDPAMQQLRGLAHSKKWSQEDFSAALGIYAGAQAREMQQLKEARDYQVQKLGAAGPTRVSAVTTWIKGMVGDELAQAMGHMLVTEDIVRGFEKLIQRSTGGGNFSQSHREPPPADGTIPGIEHMSFREARAAQDARRR